MDPRRDMPRGILAGMFTLIVFAFLILWLNPAVVGVGSHALGKSGEPLLDGFRAIYGENIAKLLALVAVVGLIASFHTIIFAKGRQIYSLSRAGYFPSALSVTHGSRKTPHVAMMLASVVALAVMFVLWFSLGADRGSAVIGGTLLNMAVFGAMFSYVMQAALVHPAAHALSGHGAPVPEPARDPRRRRDPRHRARHDLLPAHRPGLPDRRGLGGRLVRRGHRLLRPRRPQPPDPLAGGGVRARQREQA